MRQYWRVGGTILWRLDNGECNRRMLIEVGEPLPNPVLLQARVAALMAMLEERASAVARLQGERDAIQEPHRGRHRQGTRQSLRPAEAVGRARGGCTPQSRAPRSRPRRRYRLAPPRRSPRSCPFRSSGRDPGGRHGIASPRPSTNLSQYYS